MNPNQILHKFESLAHYYLSEMEKYTWDEFTLKPSSAEWSLGEMYNHIIETGFLQMQSLKACMEAPDQPTLKKTWVGKVVYWTGSIPPIRAKVPKSAEHTAFQPQNKQELQEKMHTLHQQMKDALSIVTTTSPDRKIEHPYFGYINAHEWYHHIVMHLAHHLRQKKRLDQFISIQRNSPVPPQPFR